jgi:DNA-binding response OmpR family regulator
MIMLPFKGDYRSFVAELKSVAADTSMDVRIHPRFHMQSRRRRDAMATILIIEDDAKERFVLQNSLSNAGFAVLVAADGASGIELAKNAAPDLVLCDIDMPGLNGFETLHALKADERTKGLPFVFITGSSEAMAGKLGRKLGAEEFIEKPFSFSKLLAVVTTTLRK